VAGATAYVYRIFIQPEERLSDRKILHYNFSAPKQPSFIVGNNTPHYIDIGNGWFADDIIKWEHYYEVSEVWSSFLISVFIALNCFLAIILALSIRSCR